MINYRVLKALSKVDELIRKELKDYPGYEADTKDCLRMARDKVQEAITYTLKGASYAPFSV